MVPINNSHRIRNSFTVSYLVLFVASILSYAFYWYSYSTHVSSTETYLKDYVQEHKSTLESYIARSLEETKSTADLPEIIARVKDLIASSNESTDRQEASKKLSITLESISAQNYKNTLLIGTDGAVIFSDFAPNYIGKNLTDASHSKSSLGIAFMQVIMSLNINVGIYTHDSVLNEPALFVLAPIFDQGKFLAVLCQKIPNTQLLAIMNDYTGLGKTGDFLFGIQQNNGFIIISGSRDGKIKPFKHFIPLQKVENIGASPIVMGCLGNVGSGIRYNYRNVLSVAAWDFLPKFEWGITAMISLEEILGSVEWLKTASLILLLLALLLFIVGCIWFGCFSHTREWLNKRVSNRWLKKLFLGICTLLSLILLSKQGFKFFIQDYHQKKELKTVIIQKSQDAIDKIERTFESGRTIAYQIAHDLHAGYLDKKDLVDRLKRDVNENQVIQGLTVAYEPYAAGSDKKLYAPMVKQVGQDIEVVYIDQLVDYTNPNVSFLGPVDWDWYEPAIKSKEEIWLEPFVDPVSELLFVGYSIPFFDTNDQHRQKPIGVINIIMNAEKIKDIIKDLSFGKQGYGYLITKKGSLVYYPISKKNINITSIIDLARKNGNNEFIKIADNIISGSYGFYSYTALSVNEKVLLYSAPIAPAQWILMVYVPDKEVHLPIEKVRQYYIQLYLLFLCFIFFLCLFIFYAHTLDLQLLASKSTIFLVLGLLGTLAIISFVPLYNEKESIMIPDQIRADKFAKDAITYAQAIHEPIPRIIPVGLALRSLSFPTPTTVAISGYIWAKFNKDVPEQNRTLQFSQAIEPPSMKKIYEKTENDLTTVAWYFNAKLSQEIDYKKYPFDTITIAIALAEQDRSQGFLLIPALDDYQNIIPEEFPGITKDLKLSGIDLQSSYFALIPESFDSNLGLQNYENVSDRLQMGYIITMTRKLLYDIIVFMLPILIIFFSLYAAFIMAGREDVSSLSTLTAYIGLIFAITLLHRSLRERYTTGDVLYLEYYFFMIYITFALLVVYTLLRNRSEKPTPFMNFLDTSYRLFFWPFQLSMLLLITLGVFY